MDSIDRSININQFIEARSKEILTFKKALDTKN